MLSLAGSEDRISVCNGTDMHLRRGIDEPQRETSLHHLTDSYGRLRIILPKYPRNLVKWGADWSFFHSLGEDSKSYVVAISTAAVFLMSSYVSGDGSACWVWGGLFLMQQSQQQQFQFHALRHGILARTTVDLLSSLQTKVDNSLQVTIVGFNTAFMPFADVGLVNESLKHSKTSRDWRNLGRNCIN